MTRRFKIAMVAACPFPYPRGTPIRVFRIAEALSRRGHEVHVVTYHLGKETETASFLIYRIPEVRTYKRYSPGPTFQKLLVLDTLLAIELLKVLRKHDIDLIHAHHYEGMIVSLLARQRTRHPILFDVHTLLESELPFYKIWLPSMGKKLIGRFLDSRLPRLASHIIAVTEDIKTKLIHNRSATSEKITVISNGVECEHFNVEAGERKAGQTETKTLIFAGNLASYQGIDVLLKAFKEVLQKRKDVKLLIVSNDSFGRFESLARTLGVGGHIDIMPSDFATLPHCIATADIALNPRKDCDGVPQKLLNYMAAGKPIVSFAGSAKHLKHGELGWIVENGNISAFANAILLLLEDSTLAQRIGANAKKYVNSELSWERATEKTEVVYEKIVHSAQSTNI
ncbi:MAG: glycosyltransferase family 4 protein [Candidatus Hodarchaeota archaeon]